MKDKKIILGVCGGIAAYKSVELLRLLIKRGADVRVVMTSNARHFVGPLTFEALSRKKVCSNLFEPHEDASIQHINWAEGADAVVIAPATANMIAKLANGIGDDALSTFMMAVTCPVMICPSMNSNMYASPAVQHNIEVLKNFSYKIVDPSAGELACGTTGPGRLPEPAQIMELLTSMLTPKDLLGKNFLITAGPTREAIDPVRFISNPSSGKMGYAVARAAERRGANVVLISGPTSLAAPANIRIARVATAAQMTEAVLKYADHADYIVKCAAVSDYRPVSVFGHKIKKATHHLELKLERTDDILKKVADLKKGQFVVGFAAETRDLDVNAVEKLKVKRLDMIVGNYIGEEDAGFECDTNRVTLYFKDGTRESLDVMTKEALAQVLLDRMIGFAGG